MKTSATVKANHPSVHLSAIGPKRSADVHLTALLACRTVSPNNPRAAWLLLLLKGPPRTDMQSGDDDVTHKKGAFMASMLSELQK